jgi:hypothetical protein
VIETEAQLLELLFSHGFDFWSSVRDIAQRFPKRLDYAVSSSEIVPFRLRSPLLGDVWKIPVNRALEMDLPPLCYRHEFHPTRDPRQNHDEAEAQFTALLGAGETGISTNVYERNWRIGFFTIRVITWPRELNRTGHNVFEGKNPNLWISANIYIEPDFPFVEPAVDASAPLNILLQEGPDFTLECKSQVYARRNRVLANTATPMAGLHSDAFVIRTHDRSVCVPLAEIQAVKHTRMTPGRYSGSSSLDIETLFLDRHKVSVSVARGSHSDSLDRIAEPLAQALSKPLAIEEYSDDG